GLDRIADTCRATVRVCRSAGVFDVPGAVEAFAAYRLFPTHATSAPEAAHELALEHLSRVPRTCSPPRSSASCTPAGHNQYGRPA
ncbi:MAG: hypothetical protein ACRDSF_28400, partial [Pseudonocardiaceae bacterium]